MSRFDDLLKNAPRRSAPPEPKTELAPRPGSAPAAATLNPPALPTAPRGPGRPKGKKSDPAFRQVSVYIADDLHHKVKGVLHNDRRGQEFSELVGALLTEWLARRTAE